MSSAPQSDPGVDIDRDTGADLAVEVLRQEDALVSRLAVIAGQPLSERADSLAQLHDEMRTRLESGDHPRPSA